MELLGVKICFSQVAQNCRKLAAMPGWTCSAIVSMDDLALPSTVIIGGVLGVVVLVVDLFREADGWHLWPKCFDMAYGNHDWARG